MIPACSFGTGLTFRPSMHDRYLVLFITSKWKNLPTALKRHFKELSKQNFNLTVE